MSVPFVHNRNTRGPQNVMSILQGAHSVGDGILGHLNEENKGRLKLTSKLLEENVKEASRGSMDIVIKGSLERWRKANPNAKYANISGRKDLTDEDFVHLKGIKHLNMQGCNQAGITNQAFVHLKDIKHLNMVLCNQPGITDDAFENLEGIDTLYIRDCNQAGITGATLNKLGNKLKNLVIIGCNPNTKRVANELYGVTDNIYTVRRLHGGRINTRRKTRKHRAAPSKG